MFGIFCLLDYGGGFTVKEDGFNLVAGFQQVGIGKSLSIDLGNGVAAFEYAGGIEQVDFVGQSIQTNPCMS